MQLCTSLQTDNHAGTPPLSFLQAGCPSCHPTNSFKALKAFTAGNIESKIVTDLAMRIGLIWLGKLIEVNIRTTNQYSGVDDKGIKDSWKEYVEKLMNKENEWDHKLSAEVKEEPADCIRTDEVRAALKEMKKHKAPGLSGR